MKNLDFVVVGAQKCATTTLFELLRQHPRINLPIEKEVPFFTEDDCSPAAWQRFAKRYFGDEDDRLWGKVTPQYMANPEVPGRLAAAMPDTRIIALLRNPLERSRSHYRMGQRRATEAREFAHAMEDCLNSMALARARAGRAPTHAQGYESEGEFYLAWSEYGRILSTYRRHFPAQQMLVLYTEDLERNPRGVLEQVLAFLDLPAGFAPHGLGEVMHAGGGSNRVPHELRVWLRERGPVRALWQLVPPQQQGRLRFLYERWNTRKTRSTLPLPAALETELRDHLARDVELLISEGLPIPPWAGEYGVRCHSRELQNAKLINA